LIPNLVESVKGFADQEKSVLTEVTEARKQVTNIKVPPDIEITTIPGRLWKSFLYPQSKEMATFSEEQKAPKVDFNKKS
jgi:hypothetical protein